MQLLIIIPSQPETAGNFVTAKRFRAKLARHGWNCTILETSGDDAKKIDAALSSDPPTAVLLLHAYRSGRPWLQTRTRADLPLAVAGKLQTLPPGIRLGEESYPLREKLQLGKHTPLFLHPAGIRPVKGNLELLLMCDPIAEQQPNFNLVFCGPILDEDYTASFFDTLDDRPWAHYLGEIPKMAMADCMRQADVILNNSRSEGVSNALVEAASLGRPILACDIIGNRAVVQHGKNGLLYYGQEQFIKQALQLLRDLKLRNRLTKPNMSGYSADREGQLLAAILTQLIAGAASQPRAEELK